VNDRAKPVMHLNKCFPSSARAITSIQQSGRNIPNSGLLGDPDGVLWTGKDGCPICSRKDE